MRHFVRRAIASLPQLEEGQVKKIIDIIDQEVQDRELLERVLSSLPFGVIVVRGDHCVQFVSRPVMRHIPMNHKNIENIRVWDAILEPDISAFVKEALLEKETTKPKDFTLEIGNQEATVAVGIIPLVEGGKIYGDVVYIENVTEKRQEAARLRRAESLASMTTMAANVAHEIKNPLGSIGIHLQLMEKLIRAHGPECVEKMEGYIGILSEELERLNSIVVDYLFAVRPMDTHPQSLSINEVIDDLIKFVHHELEESNIRLVGNRDQNLPLLELDERLIKQSLLNLVKNSLMAMPGGGVLRIDTYQEGNFVHLRFKDNGVGIPQERIPKIFSPYFTTKEDGSGLGLTTVYKIMKEHGGEIQVHSKVGAGTTFILLFPVPLRDRKLLA